MTSTVVKPSIKYFFYDILIIFITAFHLIIPAQPEDLEITVNPVNVGAQSITFEIKNNTHRLVNRPGFYFQRNINGEWENTGFEYYNPEYGYTLYPTGSETECIHLENPESVTAGEYRLTVIYHVGTGINSTSKQEKTVSFTVS